MRKTFGKTCPFCTQRAIQSRVIVRNKFAMAFPSNTPIVPGHILVCPLRCVPTMNDLEDDELLALFELRRELEGALRRSLGAEGFNFAWNDASVAGQTVPHLHLHIVPRKRGDQGILGYEPRAFLYRPGSRAQSPQHELEQVARSIERELRPIRPRIPDLSIRLSA